MVKNSKKPQRIMKRITGLLFVACCSFCLAQVPGLTSVTQCESDSDYYRIRLTANSNDLDAFSIYTRQSRTDQPFIAIVLPNKISIDQLPALEALIEIDAELVKVATHEHSKNISAEVLAKIRDHTILSVPKKD